MALVDFFLTLIENFSLVDFLLPFILVFAIAFAVLDKTKIISKNKRINITLALILGLLFVLPHLTGRYESAIGFDPVDVLHIVAPQVTVILIAFVMLFILLGVVVTKEGEPGKWIVGLVNVVSIIGIALIFLKAVGLLHAGWLDWLFEDESVLAFVVMILVFGLVISYITKEEKPSQGKTKLDDVLKDLGLREKRG